jgi:hypothetical protein
VPGGQVAPAHFAAFPAQQDTSLARKDRTLSRLTLSKAMILPVLGASLAFAWPAYAQSATSAPAAAHARYDGSTARPKAEVEWFTGLTYPGTAAGLAACHAEGVIYQQSGAGTPFCWLGNPDAGRYGLYMVRVIP